MKTKVVQGANLLNDLLGHDNKAAPVTADVLSDGTVVLYLGPMKWRSIPRRLGAAPLKPVPGHPEVHKCGNLTINCGKRTVEIKRKGEKKSGKLALTKSEYLLLEILMLGDGRVLTREEVEVKLRPNNGGIGDPHYVDIHLSALRRKLREAGLEGFEILTERGEGFRINMCP